MSIVYVQGDATDPVGSGPRLIVHVCNDVGKWGKGFVLAISKRWAAPEQAYQRLFGGGAAPVLGEVQFVSVGAQLQVVNMIAQHGVRRANAKAPPPIRYDALRTALARVAQEALAQAASVHMPRIGCGLAGGQWALVEPIIEQTLIEAAIPTTVYDLV